MRLTTLGLAALVGLVATGCGGDDTDETETPRTPRSAADQPADTTLGDTVSVPDSLGVAGRPGPTGQPGQTGETAGSERSGQPEQTSAASGEAGRSARAGQPDRSSRLYTVQVAAFTEAASATDWAGRLRSQGMPVWTSVVELGGQTFYRLRVGAVPTVAEARRLGGLITSRYEWPVWVAPLTAADHPPEGAVDASRRLIESG